MSLERGSEERPRVSSRPSAAGGAVRSALGAGTPTRRAVSAEPIRSWEPARVPRQAKDSRERGRQQATAMFGDAAEEVRSLSRACTPELRQVAVTNPATGKAMVFYGERPAASRTTSGKVRGRGTFTREVFDTRNEDPVPRPRIRHGTMQEHTDVHGRRSIHLTGTFTGLQAAGLMCPRMSEMHELTSIWGN